MRLLAQRAAGEENFASFSLFSGFLRHFFDTTHAKGPRTCASLREKWGRKQLLRVERAGCWARLSLGNKPAAARTRTAHITARERQSSMCEVVEGMRRVCGAYSEVRRGPREPDIGLVHLWSSWCAPHLRTAFRPTWQRQLSLLRKHLTRST